MTRNQVSSRLDAINRLRVSKFACVNPVATTCGCFSKHRLQELACGNQATLPYVGKIWSMSTASKKKKSRRKKVTVPDIVAMKQTGQKITMLTAYDYTMARILDDAGVDTLLVGDSMAMVVQGHETTCLLYTSPSPRDATLSRMPSSA